MWFFGRSKLVSNLSGCSVICNSKMNGPAVGVRKFRVVIGFVDFESGLVEKENKIKKHNINHFFKYHYIRLHIFVFKIIFM